LSLNKELVKDKLTFSALITNPINKYRNNIETKTGPDFTQIVDNRNYFRGFGVALNYRFGKLKGEIKKNKRSIINDDEIGK
jgi:ferric enterobactin receptor